MKKTITILLISLALASCGKTNKIEGNKIVKTNDAYYLYYNNNIIKLDPDTYLTTNKKVKDYFKASLFNNEQQDFLLALKKYFPHGFNGIEKGEKPSNFILMPTITLKDNENIVDSVAVLNELSKNDMSSFIEIDETKDVKEEAPVQVNLKDKRVFIYNANGKNGLAKEVGDVLKNKFEMQYDAKNYNQVINGVTVINHKLNEKELNEVLNALNYTQANIKTDTLNNDYDLVLIIGKDVKEENKVEENKEVKEENKVMENKNTTTSSSKIKIDVISKSGNRAIERSLPDFNIATKKDKTYRAVSFPDKTIIRYNPKDKEMAVKLNKKILNSSLKEDTNLNNKIVITTK